MTAQTAFFYYSVRIKRPWLPWFNSKLFYVQCLLTWGLEGAPRCYKSFGNTERGWKLRLELLSVFQNRKPRIPLHSNSFSSGTTSKFFGFSKTILISQLLLIWVWAKAKRCNNCCECRTSHDFANVTIWGTNDRELYSSSSQTHENCTAVIRNKY